ncbi:hypothetical protein BaRGS_00017461 [Batillaria attramentaria]|uniref:Uncharacterized protein n=1 Tax=Batillaria attramentaria TaxID=370345 RepID=A0ABD0KVZ6_9CAEN
MLKPRCLFLLGIALGLDGSVQAVRIEECASGHVNVRENSLNYSLTCRDYTDTVTWSYTTARSAVILGTCSASSCTLRTGLPQFFSLTRLSESSSRLTVTYTLRESGSLRYGCGTSTAGSICQSDVIG